MVDNLVFFLAFMPANYLHKIWTEGVVAHRGSIFLREPKPHLRNETQCLKRTTKNTERIARWAQLSSI